MFHLQVKRNKMLLGEIPRVFVRYLLLGLEESWFVEVGGGGRGVGGGRRSGNQELVERRNESWRKIAGKCGWRRNGRMRDVGGISS